MQFHILFALCVALMSGCIAHGENDIEQDRNKVVARAGNLESRLIVNMLSSMQSDIRELKTEMTKYEEELAEIKIKHEAEISELKAKLEKAEELEQLKTEHEAEILELKAQIETADIAYLKDEISQIKKECKSKPRTVYAQVQLLGQNTLAAGARVKFTGTIANIGEAYKTAQGYFEAPYNGTYLFTASFCLAPGNWVEFRIVQDSNILSEGFPGDSEWHACACATAATYMRTGSKVWIELDRVHGGVITSGAGIPSFTGVLLNNFKKP